MKPKLYQYAACPFCNKVMAALQYKGVDYETVEVHPLNKKEIKFSPDYQAVPIYIDSKGQQVNDSTPIMRWIDQEFPEPRIFTQDSTQKQKEDEWLMWSDKFVRGLPPALYDTFPNALHSFNYITKVGKFNWFEKRFIKYFGAFVMSLVAKKIRKREGIENPQDFLRAKAGEWTKGLNGHPFMGGETPQGADLAVFGITRSVRNLPAEAILKENQEFAAWMNRMEAKIQSSAKLQHAN